MSGYARDKLYNGYLRKKMGCIASTVKVRQIIPHLPCLTSHDREQIEAKRETSGNYNAMQLLLACLRVRDKWPEEFISALEACGHTTMAAEMRQEYDSLRDQGNPNPPAPAAHVVTAHVHPPPPSPSANQSVSIPECVDNNQAAVVPPPLAPPESQPESQSETPPSQATEASAKTASSDPAPRSPLASPETTTTTLLSPPPEPEENSDVDVDLQGSVSDEGIDGEVTSDPEPTVEVHAVTATLATPEVSPPQSPPPPQTDLDETDELAVEVTPENGVDETPVEDTPDPEPPVEVTPHTKPSIEETPEPPVEETPEPPVDETPVEDTPDPESPVEVTPHTGPSVEETPEPPVEETPEPPVDETPVEDTPDPEPPVEVTPHTEPSVEETPEPPIEETPEPPVDETPVEDTPGPEPPVDETPDTEHSVEETPELPADETSVEESQDPEPPVDETIDTEPSVEETLEPKAPVEVTLDTPVEETPDTEPPVEETPEPELPVEETPDAEPPVEKAHETEAPVEEILEPKAPVDVIPGPPVEETPDPEPIIEETLEPEPLVEVHAVAATLQPDRVQSAALEVSPPKSPSQTDLDETDAHAHIMTPEKCLVQDTTAPEGKGAPTVLEPEEHSAPIAVQAIQNGLDTTGTTTIPAEGQNAFLSDGDDVHVSKPGLLSNEEPYSGNTTCLESSEAAADSELTTQVSAPAVACSGAILVHQAAPTPSPPSCQENGVVEELLPHNESPCQSSLGDHSILVHAVHVSEPPAIQNQDGQTQNAHASETQPVQNNSEPEIVNENPSSVSPELSSHSCEDNRCKMVVGNGASMSEGPQLRNGQATSALTKELNSAPELAATAVTVSFNAASNDNCHPSESRAAGAALELKPQDPMDKKPWSSTKSSHTKYFMTAAGVGACALFMAWKLKH